jgi:hypothetical protein
LQRLRKSLQNLVWVMRKFMYAQIIVSYIEGTRKIMTYVQNVELQGGKIKQITRYWQRRKEERRPQIRCCATFQSNLGLKWFLCTKKQLG